MTLPNIIVFQIEGLPVSILTPCSDQYPLIEIGKKDVPAGVPFWIVESSTIPTDRTFRDAWELDVASLGEPSGFGGAA